MTEKKESHLNSVMSISVEEELKRRSEFPGKRNFETYVCVCVAVVSGLPAIHQVSLFEGRLSTH